MSRLKEIVIATNNPSKKVRCTRIFSGLADKILVLKDLGVNEKPDETGITAEENAEIKARFYVARTKLPTFSEDEALYVDFLPEDLQPGVHVRRINGRDEVSDNELLEYWERLILKAPKGKRTGHWHVAYSLAIPGKGIRTVALNYPLLFFSPSSKIRLPGWPMSSLEGSTLIGKPHAEFTDEENKLVDQRAEELIKEKIKELY